MCLQDRVIPIYPPPPPNFVCGGYSKRSKTCTDSLPLKKHILSQNEWRHRYNIIFYLTYTNIQYILREPSWSWSYGSWIYNYLVIQSVSITTNVSLNPAHGEVYSIQHYVIKVCQWLGAGLWFPPRYNWNIVESGVKHHKTKPNQGFIC